MSKASPNRKETREAAEKLLLGLLRSPKTRAGLIAAVVGHGVTRNFVYGFLGEATRTGTVTMFKSTNPVKYQATASIVIEQPAPGEYPTWLEPRVLPNADRRRIFIDAQPVQNLQGVSA